MARNTLKEGTTTENSIGIGSVGRTVVRGRAGELATQQGEWVPRVTAADFETARQQSMGEHLVPPRLAMRERAAKSEDGEPAARAAGNWGRRIAPVRTALGLGLAGLLALSVAAADEKPVIDAQAGLMLKRMGDYLGKTPFFSVSVEVWQDLQLASGQRIQAGRTIALQVRRPDRLRAEVHSPRHNRELVYDGSAVTLLNRAENLYGTVRASGSLDEAMDIASERFGITMPLEDFVRADPSKDLLQKARTGLDIGLVTVMGVPCEHLAFTQDSIDWQLWIEAGARPVPRKFVITYKDEPDSPQFTAVFTNWDFATPLPDFLFTFEPPPGAVKVKVKEMKAQNQTLKTEAK